MITANGVLIESNRIPSLDTNENIVVCYVPITMGKSLQVGMEALVTPTSVDRQKCGHMVGVIIAVDEYITTFDSIKNTLGEDNMMAEQFMGEGPVVAVICELKPDGASLNGFYWSNRNGYNVHLSEGMLVTVDVVTEKTAPISNLFPAIGTEE